MRRADDQKGIILLMVMLVVFIGMLLLTGVIQSSLLVHYSLRHQRQQITQRWALLGAESMIARSLYLQLAQHHSQLTTGALAATGTTQDSNGQAIRYQVKDLSGCFNLNWLFIQAKKADRDGVRKNMARDWINAVLAKQGFSPLPPQDTLKIMLNGAEFTDTNQLGLLALPAAEKNFLQRIGCVWPIFSLSATPDAFKINVNAITQETLPLLAEMLHVTDNPVLLTSLLQSRPATGWREAKDLPMALAHDKRYLNFGSHHYLLTLILSSDGHHVGLSTLLYFYQGRALVYRRRYFIDSGEFDAR
ncbi:general secretion pathway protein GspK [Dickeya dadantii]|nr:general secretion pathway protein GspK [Dickeya dadantii]